jgi:hypothetical protein
MSRGTCEYKSVDIVDSKILTLKKDANAEQKQSEECKKLYCLVTGAMGTFLTSDLRWLIVLYGMRRWEWSEYCFIGGWTECKLHMKDLQENPSSKISIDVFDTRNHSPALKQWREVAKRNQFLSLTEAFTKDSPAIRFRLSPFLQYFECSVGVFNRDPKLADSSSTPLYFGMKILTGQWFRGSLTGSWVGAAADDEGELPEGDLPRKPYQLCYPGDTWITMQVVPLAQALFSDRRVPHQLVISVSYTTPENQKSHTWTSSQLIEPYFSTLFPTIVVCDLFKNTHGSRVPPLAIEALVA